MKAFVPFICYLVVVLSATARADIFRWDNSQLIPGTEGITPGPGVVLDHHELAFAALSERNLTSARFDFSNLTSARLGGSTLTSANLSGANLTAADLDGSTLTNANLSGANLTNAYLQLLTLTNANLSGANLTNARLDLSTLTNANLKGAVVTGVSFAETTLRGFTQAQLASTASYQSKNLQGIELPYNDLTGWDFSLQNLTHAQLSLSTLTNANLAGADLTNAFLYYSTLTNANLTGAVVTGTGFGEALGFTQAQLASTASYQTKNLQGIKLWSINLTGWDFSGQNLTDASLYSATLRNVNLTGAVVTGASFWETTSRGFTQAQLASTASYRMKNLQGIGLGRNNLTGWDFSGQNLTNADLFASTLTNANLTGADTRGAQYLNLTGATARNAILPDGTIAGLNLAVGETLVAYADVAIAVKLAGGFSIDPTAKLDLTDNDAIVQSSAAGKAADLGKLYNKVKQGFNSGDWKGPGITSATASANPARDTGLVLLDNALSAYSTFSSEAVTADSILLKYTYYGDVDLNGQVDADDLTVFANNFGRTASAMQVDGDIDFDGAVDADDLTVFANNFNKGVGNPLAAATVAAVPEPATMLLAGTAGLLLLLIRRRASLTVTCGAPMLSCSDSPLGAGCNASGQEPSQSFG